jgi:hypothetical protein
MLPLKYREDFYFVEQFHGSALHSDPGPACCKVHTNCADESAYLMANKIQNELQFTDHRY